MQSETLRSVSDRWQDTRRHDPPAGASDLWHEAFALLWYDSSSRAGGFHHVGLQHRRQRADVWDFLVHEGTVVAAFQSLTLPFPDTDLDSLRLGPLHVTTADPTISLQVDDDHSPIRSSVTYRAFAPPVYHSVDLDGAAIGGNHYDSVGAVEGTLIRDGRTVTIQGVGFQDHSWGPRDYSAILTHRWIWATFGPDFYLMVFAGWTPNGQRTTFGYVFDEGRRTAVTEASYGLRVHDDGHTPAGCDARLVTAEGREYRVTGESDVGSVISHERGFFMTDAFARFECEGRNGAGIIEARELAGPAPWHAHLLDSAG